MGIQLERFFQIDLALEIQRDLNDLLVNPDLDLAAQLVEAHVDLGGRSVIFVGCALEPRSQRLHQQLAVHALFTSDDLERFQISSVAIQTPAGFLNANPFRPPSLPWIHA
ncbi:MAG: hypothetical protein R3E12_08415 [Candidatus Eisenbacteria bacterium]